MKRCSSLPRSRKADRLRAYLETLPPHALADLLMEQAEEDEVLRAKLLARASATSSDATSLIRSAIDLVVAVQGHIRYQEAFAYSVAVHEVIDQIDAYLESGAASDVIELCEYALAAIEKAIGNVDD